jgi:hypothetical protein
VRAATGSYIIVHPRITLFTLLTLFPGLPERERKKITWAECTHSSSPIYQKCISRLHFESFHREKQEKSEIIDGSEVKCFLISVGILQVVR